MPATSRSIQDASTSVKVTAAMPNAAVNSNTSVIDLGSIAPFPINEAVSVKISSTASASTANSKNCNIRLMHSNESADNFTNIAELPLPTLRVADSGGTTPAGTVTIKLPDGVYRYIKGVGIGEANGGAAGTDATYTVQLLF